MKSKRTIVIQLPDRFHEQRDVESLMAFLDGIAIMNKNYDVDTSVYVDTMKTLYDLWWFTNESLESEKIDKRQSEI